MADKIKAGVYIDGANIFHGGRKVDWQLDYIKVKNFLLRKYDPAIISYYSCYGYERDPKGGFIKDEKGKYVPRESEMKFYDFLKGSGIRVVIKPLKFISGDENNPANKMDGDLMIDAFDESDLWDELVLFAGDCDFERLVRKIASLKKKVQIFSYENHFAHELKMLGLQNPYVSYTLLDDIRNIVCRDRDMLDSQ
jgi:uncharacterized LabA/DUF88 family protein